MPGAVLQRDREDVHHRVVQRLAAGIRIELLRIAGTRYRSRRGCGGWCAARSTRSGRDRRSVRASGGRGRSAPGSGTRRSVPWCSCRGWRAWPRLAPGSGTWYSASGPPSSQAMTPSSPSQIGDGAPSPRIARSTASTATLPASAGAYAFQLEMAPLRDWRVAVVGVQRLPDGLVDGLGVEAEQGADAGRGRRAQVGDMVDLVLVQADCPHQVDLDLVAGGEAADQVRDRSRPACCATARIGGMLSPGCEYSAARKVSWKSSSRTATPLAHAAHSGEYVPPTPNTLAPGLVRDAPAPAPARSRPGGGSTRPPRRRRCR